MGKLPMLWDRAPQLPLKFAVGWVGLAKVQRRRG